jgi:hypothetical protein
LLAVTPRHPELQKPMSHQRATGAGPLRVLPAREPREQTEARAAFYALQNGTRQFTAGEILTGDGFKQSSIVVVQFARTH